LFSDVEGAANSILSIRDETTLVAAATRAPVTLPPPAIASATQSSQAAESTSAQGDDDGNEDDSESDDEGESTTSAAPSSTSAALSSNSAAPSSTSDTDFLSQTVAAITQPSSEWTTSAVSSSTSEPDSIPPTVVATTQSSETPTSAAPTPSQTLESDQVTATAPAATNNTNNNDGNKVPPVGIAVATVMSLVIVSLTAWLIFKFHPKTQAWWTARKYAQFHQRSFRDASGGPGAGSSNLRQQALGSNANISRRQTIKSFFVPATAKLGEGKEIKRKPVNWGVENPKAADDAETSEKVPMTATAAPMGQIERYSIFDAAFATRPVSPVSLRTQESLEKLPPISPMNSASVSVRELPANPASAVKADADKNLWTLPPVPSLPPLIHAKRGSDGLFRLV